MQTKTIVLLTLCLASQLLAQAAESTTNGGGGSSSSASSSSTASKSTATQSRQSGMSAAASVIGALGSLVPGLITNVAPLVVLFGLGALMMPALGMSAMGLLREARRSGNDHQLPNGGLGGNFQLPAAFAQYARPLQTSPQDIYYFTKRSFPSIMSQFNSQAVLGGFQDLLERVGRAIENADKRYS